MWHRINEDGDESKTVSAYKVPAKNVQRQFWKKLMCRVDSAVTGSHDRTLSPSNQLRTLDAQDFTFFDG